MTSQYFHIFVCNEKMSSISLNLFLTWIQTESNPGTTEKDRGLLSTSPRLLYMGIKLNDIGQPL